MNESNGNSQRNWDEDELPEWTDDQFARAQIALGKSELRPATGTLTRSSGRPPSPHPKQQVTLRLDPDVLDAFRATGKGWQSRINAELRKALGI